MAARRCMPTRMSAQPRDSSWWIRFSGTRGTLPEPRMPRRSPAGCASLQAADYGEPRGTETAARFPRNPRLVGRLGFARNGAQHLGEGLEGAHVSHRLQHRSREVQFAGEDGLALREFAALHLREDAVVPAHHERGFGNVLGHDGEVVSDAVLDQAAFVESGVDETVPTLGRLQDDGEQGELDAVQDLAD